MSLDTATQQAALISRDIDGVFGGASLPKHWLSGQARVVGSTNRRPVQAALTQLKLEGYWKPYGVDGSVPAGTSVA